MNDEPVFQRRRLRALSRGPAIAALCFAAAAPLTPMAAATPERAPSGPPKLRAFTGARLVPISGPVVDDGVLLVEGSRIAAAGERSKVRIPATAEIRDLKGKWILPGLVDTHSHVGEVAGADSSAPIQPEIRVLDAINIRSAGLTRARAGGITTVNIMPGSGHLLSGQTVYLKLRKGSAIEDLLIRNEDGSMAGGVKMANGTNSRRDPPFPGTRAKSAALVREKFVAAREYREKIARAKGDPEKMPDRDLGLETLVEILDGKRVVHHHTHRHDDVMTVLRLKEEFGFRVVLHHVSEAWKVADRIAAAGIPSSIIVVDSPGGKLEARDMRLETGSILEKAGASVAFHTDDWITDSRWFLRSPALAVRAGMSREGALRAVTLSGAEILDLGARIGSLEAGKEADFILLSGDPLSLYTRVLETWVEGEKVFDLSDPKDRLVAEGGYGAGEPGFADLDCFAGDEEAR